MLAHSVKGHFNQSHLFTVKAGLWKVTPATLSLPVSEVSSSGMRQLSKYRCLIAARHEYAHIHTLFLSLLRVLDLFIFIHVHTECESFCKHVKLQSSGVHMHICDRFSPGAGNILTTAC